MQVAECYGDQLITVISLGPKALYELAASSTPPEVREEIERRIAAGEIISAADVKRIKYFFIGLRRKQFSLLKKSFWRAAKSSRNDRQSSSPALIKHGVRLRSATLLPGESAGILRG